MRDIIFKNFIVQNFLSIGNEPIEINFRTGLHLITGINKDKEGRRNGVGKSTLMDGLHWVLFGTPLREINKDTIANFNTKGECKATLEFDINISGKVYNYKIVRVLSPGKCYLFIDGEDKTLSTVPKTNELITNILGFNSSLFKNSVMLSINNTQAFLSQDKTTKRKFIEGIFNLEVFSDILKEVREKSIEFKNQITINTTKIDEKKQSINLYLTQKDIFEKDRVEKIAQYTVDIEKYEKQLHELTGKYIDVSSLTEKQSLLRSKKKNISDQITILSQQCESAQSSIWSDESLISSTKKDIEVYKRSVQDQNERKKQDIIQTRNRFVEDFNRAKQKKIDDIENEKKNYIKDFNSQINTKVAVIEQEKRSYIASTQATICPTCKRPLKEKIEPDTKLIESWDNQLKLLKESTPDKLSIDQFNTQIEDLKKQVPDEKKCNEYDEHLKQLTIAQPDEGVLNALSKKIEDLNNEITTFKQQITTLETEGIQKIDEAIDHLQQNIQKNNQVGIEIEFCKRQVNTLKKQVDDISNAKNTFLEMLNTANSEFDVLKVQHDELTKMFNIYESVKYIVSEEGVKTFIIKRLLSVLNDRIEYYLRKLDSNCSFTFDEFFEETIKNDKGVKCSYYNFSGAEMKTIDLACLFAFMDLRRMQGDVTINISMFDELLDSSFDEKGIEMVTSILNERVTTNNDCIYIISHRKEGIKSVTGDVIMLEKSNGVTRKV